LDLFKTEEVYSRFEGLIGSFSLMGLSHFIAPWYRAFVSV